jgi:hypothetical protein
MFFKKRSTGGGRRGLIATATAVVLVLSGAGLVGLSIASQRRAPQPPETNDSAALPTWVEASDPWLRAMTAIAPPRGEPATNVVGPTLPSSKPVTLDIPSIGVHTGLLHLGQTAGGALEVPAPGPHYDEAAWYRYSPTPGSLGPAILLGHVDSAAGGPSVFFRLGEMRTGDRVSITRADGSIALFIVDEVHRYAKDEFPTQLVYRNLDHAGLRLLTCGGPFDEATGHYLDNIVVFASLVGS